MAQTGFPAKWFVALDGKKVGPFAPEQILGLLADGEIPESVRVSVDAGAEPLAAGVHPEMTASELREIYFREDRIPTALPVIQAMPDIPFAPDLPLDGEKSREILVANELATTRRLFDLFQTAREKRAARFAPSTPVSAASSPAGSVLRNPIAIAASVAVIGAAAFIGLRSQETSDRADRELAQVSKRDSADAAPAARMESPKAEVAKAITAPAFVRPKAPLRNSWKPGKSLAKVIPPPIRNRPEDRREDERRDERDERNMDQWNQAQDPQQQQQAAPLVNQMANQMVPPNGMAPPIQPLPGADLGPDGQPLPMEAPMNQQNPGAGPNDQPFNQ